MNKRKLIISGILTLLILLVGMFVFQKLGTAKKPVQKNFDKKALLRDVELKQYKVEDASNYIVIDGRLSSYESVNLFSKVTGILLSTSKPFKKGTYFQKGDVLFEIDKREARYNLFALRSNLLNQITQIMPDLKIDYPDAFEKWKRYLDAFDAEQSTKELPVVTNDQEKYYVAAKNIYNTYYSIKSQEARLADYSVTAPFSGVVTVANVYAGSMISPGQQLGTLMNSSYFELEAPLSESQLQYIKVGQRVELYSDISGKKWTGKVNRISSSIDPVTQSIPVFIGVSGSGLKDGMYLKGTLRGNPLKNVMSIPKDIIVNQEFVLTVADSIVNQVKVNIVSRDDEKVFVTDLDPKLWVISSLPAGLYEGQKINPKKIEG